MRRKAEKIKEGERNPKVSFDVPSARLTDLLTGSWGYEKDKSQMSKFPGKMTAK